ncbi:MAG: MotA/TolQ/ExbB proton channel family protein [Elusimicrobia bacterium]|nr:MotA/TolQ/ExbB proton channel family protein [Elusimicrobiota bacterium]
MIAQGWPILSVLLVCSIVSIAIIGERWIAFRKALRALPALIHRISEKTDHAGAKEEKERVANKEIRIFLLPLESGISALGTIAATTPFIGLLGTVVGIIRSFRAVSVSMAGGHAVVAAGIAEALIATAFGLFVAIPAVVFYNYFTRKLEVLEQKASLAAEEIIFDKKR